MGRQTPGGGSRPKMPGSLAYPGDTCTRRPGGNGYVNNKLKLQETANRHDTTQEVGCGGGVGSQGSWEGQRVLGVPGLGKANKELEIRRNQNH